MVSTLVLTLHIDIKDAATGKTIYARLFDFRGDNERAYAHAAQTLVRSLKAELAPRASITLAAAESAGRPTPVAPIKIAVFDFELDDPSAGGGVIAQDAADKMLFQHDANQPIGVWSTLNEDARGLWAQGRLMPEVAKAREVHALMRARVRRAGTKGPNQRGRPLGPG
jgi:prohead serine protease